MAYQVGVGEVPIVPTLRGFRRTVGAEVDTSAKSASSSFRKLFSNVGTESGRSTGKGFRSAFEQQSTGFSAKAVREIEQSVAKSARAVSAARLKEQDVTGKVRVAEAQLAEARGKYASDSSQVIRAEERLAAASRQLGTAQNTTRSATDDLRSAQGRLAVAADAAGDELAESGQRNANRFVSGFRSILGGSFLGSFLGNITSSITAGIGNAIQSGLRSGVEFLQESTVAASDLNESLNAINVAFGPVASQIASLGTTAADRLGLSNLAFNQFATQFSAFAGTIRGNDVAGFIDELTTRGADFASVYNIEVADALELFQSGLAGETEPLRRYGLDLSAATVEAYAYATGIGEAGTELTEAQKQQARYGALLQQTAKVQGDFTNTSGELANQQRILTAEWTNAQAKLGTALLPSLTQLANVANDSLVPALNEVIDKVGPQLGTALTDATPALVDLVKAVAEALPDLISLGVEALPLIIQGAQIIVPLLKTWAENWSGVMTITNATFQLFAGDTSIAKLIGDVLNATGVVGSLMRGAVDAGKAFGGFAASVVAAASQIGVGVASGVNTAISFVQSLPQRAVAALGNVGSLLYNSGRSLIQGWIDGIRDMIDNAGNAVSDVMDWVRGFFPNSPAKRGPLSGSGWTKLGESGGAVVEQWVSGFGRPDLTAALAPAFAVAGSPARSTSDGHGAVSGSRAAPTVIQHVTMQPIDPRLQARQLERESRKAFASS